MPPQRGGLIAYAPLRPARGQHLPFRGARALLLLRVIPRHLCQGLLPLVRLGAEGGVGRVLALEQPAGQAQRKHQYAHDPGGELPAEHQRGPYQVVSSSGPGPGGAGGVRGRARRSVRRAVYSPG